MPKMQSVRRQAAGLKTQYNQIGAEEGALLEAENCVIDREGIIGKRRGFTRYGAEFPASVTQLIEFRDRAVAYAGTTFRYDADGAGAWTAWAGSWSPPDSTARPRGVEARSNLYVTTSKGPIKIDSLTGTPRRAGMPQGLDTDAFVLLGSSGSWLQPDTQVGYRIVWTRTDANNMLVAGAPSYRVTLVNPQFDVSIDWDAGIATVTHVGHPFPVGGTAILTDASESIFDGTHTITAIDSDHYWFEFPETPDTTFDVTARIGLARDVVMTFTVPEEVIAGDKFEIYRTEMSASAGTDPGDRHFLIASKAVTSAEITAKIVNFLDTFDESYLGIELVTNPTLDTITQANDRPPWCRDMALYKGHLFFLNTRQTTYAELQLLSLSTLTADVSSLVFAGRTYTFSATEDIANRKVKIHSDEAALSVGIEKTMRSLARCINRDPGSTVLRAYYISGIDDPPGKILVRARELDTQAIIIAANSTTTGDSFQPAVPITPTFSTKNDAKPNRLYRAKFEQPEAVPALNYDDVGNEDSHGLRILPLRDSLIILKEDGVFRLSGDSESSFFISPLDRSVRLLAPETAVVLDDSVYCLSNQGIIKINENGTAIVSRDIEPEIQKIASFTNFRTITHAVAYETDRKYILFAQSASTDTVPTRAWCYNYLTGAWTSWSRGLNAAIVLQEADRFFGAHTADRFVLRERKSLSDAPVDYSDEDISITVTATGTTTVAGATVSTATVNYSYAGLALSEGFLLSQGFSLLRVKQVTSLGGTSYGVVLDEYASSLTTGAATMSLPIAARVRWAPDSAGDPASLKHFKEAQLYFEDAVVTEHRMGFLSDFSSHEEQVVAQLAASRGWGRTPWGQADWGDSGPATGTVLRSFVPRTKARSRALSIAYEHRYARETFAIAQMTTVFRSIGERSTRAPR